MADNTKEALEALTLIEAEVARLREIADWYEDRNEAVPIEVEEGLDTIGSRLASMLREPTSH